MSEHLPEVQRRWTLEPMVGFPKGFTYMDGYDHAPVGEDFILYADHVSALRACEERVLQEQIVGRQYDMVMGYQRGLAAARRAVQSLPKGGMGLKAHALWRDALAAIDALKENK